MRGSSWVFPMDSDDPGTVKNANCPELNAARKTAAFFRQLTEWQRDLSEYTHLYFPSIRDWLNHTRLASAAQLTTPMCRMAPSTDVSFWSN